MASDTTAANQEQLMALMGAFELELTSTGAGTPKVICRLYRKPSSYTYTKQILDAGMIWQVIAFKKPPVASPAKPAGAPDDYDTRANWTNYSSGDSGYPTLSDGTDFFENDAHNGVDDNNVKIRNYWTFSDARAKMQEVANLITSP